MTIGERIYSELVFRDLTCAELAESLGGNYSSVSSALGLLVKSGEVVKVGERPNHRGSGKPAGVYGAAPVARSYSLPTPTQTEPAPAPAPQPKPVAKHAPTPTGRTLKQCLLDAMDAIEEAVEVLDRQSSQQTDITAALELALETIKGGGKK